MSYLDDPELLERLRSGFRATPLHALLGIDFVDDATFPDGTPVSEGIVVVSMPVRPEAFGQGGNLHGGAIATLIDVASASAAARASAFEPGKNSLVTADLHVRYLGRAKGNTVSAYASVVRSGRQLVVVECRVLDDLGNLVAVADFSSMVVPLRGPLPGAVGDPAAPDL
ncbi:MAG: PaaI family thioesterase [Acidimicrobiales bacterium]|nr:PaaI family thioesterase [Acidimicrobiales bacterium]